MNRLSRSLSLAVASVLFIGQTFAGGTWRPAPPPPVEKHVNCEIKAQRHDGSWVSTFHNSNYPVSKCKTVFDEQSRKTCESNASNNMPGTWVVVMQLLMNNGVESSVGCKLPATASSSANCEVRAYVKNSKDFVGEKTLHQGDQCVHTLLNDWHKKFCSTGKYSYVYAQTLTGQNFQRELRCN